MSMMEIIELNLLIGWMELNCEGVWLSLNHLLSVIEPPIPVCG